MLIRKPKVSIPYVPGFYESIQIRLDEYDIISIPRISNKIDNIVVKGKDTLRKEDHTTSVVRVNEHKDGINKLIDLRKKFEQGNTHSSSQDY